MNYRFEYVVENFTKEDILILDNSFIPNMKENSIKGRTTLDRVLNINKYPNHKGLEIDVEVVSDSDESQLNKSIHGGLGKALGKGRVKRR
jgi:hypothetical protein